MKQITPASIPMFSNELRFLMHGTPEDTWNTLAPQTIQENEDIVTLEEELDPEYLILQPGNELLEGTAL